MRLAQRTAVITGAGHGIGRACALAFAAEGARVMVADIDAGGAGETVRQIECFSRVDTLLNNAAIQVNKTIEETSPEEWDRQLAVNLGGLFLCSKYFLPHLRQSRGSIVNMASVNAFFMEPMCAGYCATKGAIVAFTKALAIDCGRSGVRVNCICPGYIDAGLAEGYFQAQPDPAAARNAAGQLHALGRIGTPEEVARVAVFLASEEASFMTGSAVVVDGGFSSGLPAST
ncbi:MAG: SDR family oxidoreductase [Candidatus Solibacter sp.]|nr:SDR family oxidoreductase [Candidatus Solibacter sp.]